MINGTEAKEPRSALSRLHDLTREDVGTFFGAIYSYIAVCAMMA
jgi:hypothetical protein